MRKLFVLILILFNYPAFAGGGTTMMMVGGGTPAAAGCDDVTGMLVAQDFEGTGYDNVSGLGGAWTEVVGGTSVVDEDDTTATVMRNSQQLKVGEGGTVPYTWAGFSASGEVWGTFLFKTNDASPSEHNYFMELFSTSSSVGEMAALTTGAVRIYHGAQDATTAGTITADTKYRVWFHWKTETPDTALNGIFEIWIDSAAATTRPASSGNYYTIESAGTNAATVNRIRFTLAGTSQINYFDHLRVDDAEFTTVCP